MYLTWVLLVLAFILFLYLWGTWAYKRFDKLNIPYDKPTPFIGNMGPFLNKTYAYGDLVAHAYKKHKGSGLYGTFHFRTPIVNVCDPELIKLVTVKDFDHFTDHYTPIDAEDDPLFGKFLFALKGDRWRFMRSTLSPAFTSSKMKHMFHLVADCGEQLGEYLAKKCQENGGLVETNMRDLFSRFGNDVIATSAFGLHCDSLNQPENELYAMGKKGVNFGGGLQLVKMIGFIMCSPLMRLFRVQLIQKDVNTFFQNIVTSTIAQREAENIIRPDMIHLLMEARKGTLKTENSDELRDEVKHDAKKTKLTEGDITAQAFLFFLAGFDTTSVNLCFVCHLLATHPAILQRVQEEIDSILEEGGGKITYEGLQRMTYTDMVINETLRLWPPAVVADRVCVKPYTIPASSFNPSVHLNVGDMISMPIVALHRDATFFENPLEFDPERFSEENKHKIKPYTYIPFGAGPRICIGMRFAVMQTKVALTSILSRFDLKVTSRTPDRLILIKNSSLVGVEGGFWLGITPRTDT